MKWASAISQAAHATQAVAEVTAGIKDALRGDKPDLLILFASPNHLSSFHDIADLVLNEVGDGVLFGCSGGGIVGNGREIEDGPALSLTAAVLPDVDIQAAHIAPEVIEHADFGKMVRDVMDLQGDEDFIILADPFSVAADALVGKLDTFFPSAVKVGGLASGHGTSDEHALFCGTQAYGKGALLVSLRGNITMDTIIAQGCRPIAEPMIVSSCEDNMILTLDNKSAVEVIRSVHESLEENDRALFRHALFLGIQMRDQLEYKHGDFLIRHLIGIDPRRGAIATGARIEPWQVVQFHLREAKASADDLSHHLDRYLDEHGATAPKGALIFSCLGRGRALYGQANHDSAMLRQRLGGVPVGGFFCNGEIGPVADRTFVHGYTSAFAVFR